MNNTMTLELFDVEPVENQSNKPKLFDNLLSYKKPPVKMDDKETQDVINNLYHAKKELEIANHNFEFAKDDELIDYYIYQIKAAETRYQYLLKQAKEKNININAIANSNCRIRE